MGSFLRKQPSFLLILLILHLGAREASALSSDDEALLAFKKAVTTSDGIFLNWREQDVYPCNWKVVCFFHSHYKSGQSSTYQKNGLCLKTFPNRAIICVDVFLRSSIIIPYDEVISSINVKIIKNNPQLNRQDKRLVLPCGDRGLK
uniref:Leucine-rich repeat-containing N-terminal plant-type domain-containing protein n=1 Tax=Oryza rufipogon TaxID=4529 RepID=A0A0E0QGE2_ORYRU